MYEYDPSTLSRIDGNRYKFNNPDWAGVITLKPNGFELEWSAISNGNESNPGCTWNNFYTLK
jgi:hypothetical protein